MSTTDLQVEFHCNHGASIKGQQADQLARELAELTGVTLTEAVVASLAFRLTEVRRSRRRVTSPLWLSASVTCLFWTTRRTGRGEDRGSTARRAVCDVGTPTGRTRQRGRGAEARLGGGPSANLLGMPYQALSNRSQCRTGHTVVPRSRSAAPGGERHHSWSHRDDVGLTDVVPGGGERPVGQLGGDPHLARG